MAFYQMLEPVGCRALCPHLPQVGIDFGWFMGMFSWLLPQLYLPHYCLADPALTNHTDPVLMSSMLPLLGRNSL